MIGIYSIEGLTEIESENRGRGIICTEEREIHYNWIDDFNYLDEKVLRFGNEENAYIEFAHKKDYEMKSNKAFFSRLKGAIKIEDI